MPRKRGRPSVYTPELAAEVCARLKTGKTLRAVCREPGMPPEATVRLWIADDRENFAAQYAQSRLDGYKVMADQVLEIADGKGEVQRARLRVDTRKWLLSKALPKIYGDKITHAGDPDQPLLGGSPVADLLAVLASINVRIEDKSE